MDLKSKFFNQLLQETAVLVTVESTRGSVPREAGAWMAVFRNTLVGTVGGGRLELEATQHAHSMLKGDPLPILVRYALGPGLGQCCGGEVHLRFELVDQAQMAHLQDRLQDTLFDVALFGGGHVGRAVVDVLTRLPCHVRWIDSRDEIFPLQVGAFLQCEHSDPVQGAVADLAPNSLVLIMSFSHAEDLDIVAACLLRQRERGDLPYVGLIGSKTKWASFRQRLLARGFSETEMAHITCPIGLSGIADKRPEVIAVSVAAQLLQVQGNRHTT